MNMIDEVWENDPFTVFKAYIFLKWYYNNWNTDKTRNKRHNVFIFSGLTFTRCQWYLFASRHCEDFTSEIQTVLVLLLLYANRHRSILGAAGHIILTPENQLMVIGLKIWSLSNPGSNQRPIDLRPTSVPTAVAGAHRHCEDVTSEIQTDPWLPLGDSE
jgi:hypothetical protein